MGKHRNSQERAIQSSHVRKIDSLTEKEKKALKRAENGGKIDLSDYLFMREQELKKLDKEVSFLQGIQIPLTLYRYGDKKIQLFSEDYSLATNFEIKERPGKCNNGGISTYDGGYHYYVRDFYPQFYFNIKDGKKSVPVYVQHKGFDKDEKIVFRRIEGCRGSGAYADRTKSNSEYIDMEKVWSYLEGKGVKKRLINRLEKKIKELNNY